MNAPETSIDQQIAAQYDSTPYTSNAFHFASPGHIRAAAMLYNIETPPLERARVLELGCAGGGNILPFALAYPEATVVGVDLSPVQIAQGRQVVADLELRNMRLHAMSLSNITPDFGEFDYIIVHGVFSWVPPEVKQAILRICRENLSPQGVAYVSYNTYPGWKAGDIVRDAMMMHSHGAETDEEKLGRAKAMLGLLSEGLAVGNPLRASLLQAVEGLQKHSDYYLAHEYLETYNTPCYFVEFADAAMQAGLAYVGDSEPQLEMPAKYGANVQVYHGVVALGQPKLARQQYLDFAVGRTFRKSLLVHQERLEQIAVTPDMQRLRDLRFSGHYRRVDDSASVPPNAKSYINSRGQNLHTTEPIVEAVMEALTQAWPRSLSLMELFEQVQPAVRSQPGVEKEQDVIYGAVVTLFRIGHIRIAAGADPYQGQSASHPAAIPGFVYLNKRSQEPSFALGAFNLWHESVAIKLSEAERWVVGFLDGRTSMMQIRSRLCQALQEGKMTLQDGKSLTGQRNLEPVAQKLLNGLLTLLRERGVVHGGRQVD